MGRFRPGQSGNPAGKKKGTVATRTRIVQSFADTIVSGGTAQFKKDLKKLTPAQRVNAYLTLMEFAIPKKARVEHSMEGEGVQVLQVFKIGDKEITLS